MSQVADFLITELSNIGFAPDSLLIKLVSSRIADRGRNEYLRLTTKLSNVGVFESKYVHHLGIGASLTEFLIAGLKLDRESRAEIATLGGIAHTIYAFFDHLLDVAGSVPDLFTENAQAMTDGEVGQRQQCVLELVKLYYEKLDLISFGRPQVRALIDRTIHKLYSAELKSASAQQIGRQAWWRKNALPLIVMALPAWLCTENGGKIKYSQHMLWLGRVGEFFGWLDDFADYEKDCRSGEANRLKIIGRESFQLFAQKVAVRGNHALELWDLHNNQPAYRNTFTVITWTSLVAASQPELCATNPPAAADVFGSSL